MTYISKGSTGGFSEETFGEHVSTRNQDRLGWAYVSYDTVANADTLAKRYDSEIVAYKLDGSKAMQRFGHTHAYEKSYPRVNDKIQAQPVPSRDGKRVLFASNWTRKSYAPPTSISDVKPYVVDASSTTPTAVGDLSLVAWTKTKAFVSWTAPDDGLGLEVSTYELRYSTSLITEANFSSATLISTGTPKYPGAAESDSVTGLSCDTQYFFAIKSSNACNKSDLSNVLCMFTLACSGDSRDCESAPRAQRIGDQASFEFAVTRVTPNPAPGHLALHFTLARQDRGSVVLHDVAGRVIERADISDRGPGPHTVAFGDGGQLRSGLYYIRVQSGTTVVRRTAVVLR